MTLDEFDDTSCLIYGIGNVGRQDDGLGWAFIDWLEAQGICTSAELRRGYQILLEDAELISAKKRVLFVDATRDVSVTSFTLERAAPKMDFSFTSHAVSIPAIMATCQQCFERLPEVHVLAIRGFAFELEMGLTLQARQNLSAATAHVSSLSSARSPLYKVLSPVNQQVTASGDECARTTCSTNVGFPLTHRVGGIGGGRGFAR